MHAQHSGNHRLRPAHDPRLPDPLDDVLGMDGDGRDRRRDPADPRRTIDDLDLLDDDDDLHERDAVRFIPRRTKVIVQW